MGAWRVFWNDWWVLISKLFSIKNFLKIMHIFLYITKIQPWWWEGIFFFDLLILRCFYRPLKSLWAFFLFWYNFWKWKLVFLFSIFCLSCRGVCLLPSKKVNSRGCVSYLQMTLFSIEKSIVNQCFKIWGGPNFFSLFDGIG